MSEIRLLKETEFDTLVEILDNAYPAFRSTQPEEREKKKERLLETHNENPLVDFYGLFREGQLRGVMRLHDFTMNFLGVQMLAGGVGAVAVDLLHKKEHVAKEMIDYFLAHYREQGAALALLYPFRPDFYKRMGFGYGPKMDQYCVKPSAFPKGPSRAHLRTLGEADVAAVLGCYTRYAQRTHGMIERHERDIKKMLENQEYVIIGCDREGRIEGYMVFDFEKGESFILNDIHIREWVYENHAALSELMTYLHAQADQVRHVIFETLDPTFYFLLSDPRNGSPEMIPSVYHESNVQGVGLMYRVIDVPRMFELLQGLDFGGQTCRLRLTLTDSFLPENAGSTTVVFQRGGVALAGEGAVADVEVRMDVAEFSSLLAGAIDFETLMLYGLAEISDPAYTPTLQRLFWVERAPVCMTAF